MVQHTPSGKERLQSPLLNCTQARPSWNWRLTVPFGKVTMRPVCPVSWKAKPILVDMDFGLGLTCALPSARLQAQDERDGMCSSVWYKLAICNPHCSICLQTARIHSFKHLHLDEALALGVQVWATLPAWHASNDCALRPRAWRAHSPYQSCCL